MGNALETWIQGEIECFTYLLDITGTKEGQSAFRGKMPPLHDAFMFALNGGPNPEYSQGCNPESFPAWIFNAELLGQYQEREDALRVAGHLIEDLNVGTTLKSADQFESVQVFRLNGGLPDVSLTYKKLANGGDELYPVWELTASFFVVVDNITQVI